MSSSDLDVLLDMGFDKERAQIAVKRSGGLQGALEWLEQTQDKPLDEIQAEESAKAQEAGPSDETEGSAQSWVCNECGKKFRSMTQVQFHGEKSGHSDFAESTEEIAPLTEEEKKAKLEELRAKLAEKRSGMSEQDKIDKKRNEEIRRKATKEQADIKEDLQKKERLKEAALKKREKQDELDAKARIRQKIAADKEERRLKAEKEKAEREGKAPPPAPVETGPTTSGPVLSKPASAYAETRLRLQTSNGNVQKSFPVETTLFEVAHAVNAESGVEVESFFQNFPKKVFEKVDFGSTLKELGLVPSASLIVR